MNTWTGQFLRIGHAGAAAYAKPNSLQSIALALEMNVDVVEFDVLPCRDALVLSHDDIIEFEGKVVKISESRYEEIRALDSIARLQEAIDLIRGRAWINVDLKGTGFEAPLVEGLKDERVLGDVMFSSLFPESLSKIRALQPEARTSISYPADWRNISKRSALKPAVILALQTMRRLLPYRIAALMARARAHMTTLNHHVISKVLIDRVHRMGGQVIAWTVDELPTMRTLHAMGVDGITTNKPDLFSTLSLH